MTTYTTGEPAMLSTEPTSTEPQNDRLDDIKSKLMRYKQERDELDKLRQKFGPSNGNSTGGRAKSQERSSTTINGLD